MLLPNTTVINYKYDALGRRVERSKSDGTWTRYSHDGLEVLREVSSDGSTVEYVNGGELDDHLWQRKGDGTTQYFLTDHQGSTRALADGSGAVVANYSYDTFGNGFSGSLTRFGYTGREQDGETGLLYYRARWYDPGQGRFVSEDPIGFGGGGANWYGYVLNDAVNGIDPSGLQAMPRHRLPPRLPQPRGPGQVIKGPWPSPRTGISKWVRWCGLVAILMMAVIQNADNVDLPDNLPVPPPVPAPEEDPCKQRYDGPKPRYTVNPAHDPNDPQGRFNPKKTPLPDDAEVVYRRSVPDNPFDAYNWFGMNDDGIIYRFSNSNDGTVHFSGRSDDKDGIRNLTPYARKRLKCPNHGQGRN